MRLSGRDYHYLVRVRRLAPGEFFPVLLPDGEEARVRVLSVEGGVLTGICEAGDRTADGTFRSGPQAEGAGAGNSRDLIPSVILFQALPKGSKMDLIVRQAAEAGLAGVVPFASAFSAARAGSLGAEKIRRWERIIKEARQQSGSLAATFLHAPLSFDALFRYWEERKGNSGLGIFFHQIPLAKTGLHDYLEGSPEIVAYAVGPEGGFSSAEASRFLAAGFKALTIGNTVLRTETAALFGAAAIKTVLLEKSSWILRPGHV